MRIMIPCLVAALALASTASADDKPGLFASPGEKLAWLVSSWEAHGVEALAAAWGREADTHRRGTSTMHVFEQTSRVRAGLTGFGQVGVTARPVTCRATFEVDSEGTVVRGTYRGTDPKACWKLFKDNEPP